MQPGKEDNFFYRQEMLILHELFFITSLGVFPFIQHLIRVIFDIKEDGQLVSDALLHCLLQSRDPLSAVSVPAEEGF